MGHTVVTAGLTDDRDVVLTPDSFSMEQILASLNPSQRPDICLFVEDIGRRSFPRGLENSPIPLVFYSIDTHLNFFWLRHFAAACDCVLTTQRDYLDMLRPVCGRAHWLPWGYEPQDYMDLGLERDLDISFVGTVDAFRGRRKSMLEQIARSFNISIFTPSPDKWYSASEISGIFSRSKIVINEAISFEVNFRVFETLPTGAMLLTERVGNGLAEMFEDNRHLVTFTPLDLMEKIAHYLGNDGERERIAAAGKEEAARGHTRLQRARILSGILEECEKTASHGGGDLGRSYFLMLRRGVVGEEHSLPMTEELLVGFCMDSPCSAEAHVSLGEFYMSCGLVEKAAACYALGWKAGGMGFRGAAQWGLLLLGDGKPDEARTLFGYILGLDLPGPLWEGLSKALKGPLPSPELYLWLGRVAETTFDAYLPGFFPQQLGKVPITGADYLQTGLGLFPDSMELLEELGDIYQRNGVHLLAASSYLKIVEAGGGSDRLCYKTALALLQIFRRQEALNFAEIAWRTRPEQEYLELMLTIQKGMGNILSP